ncbi:hypothetical protein F8M41_022552 [Gigaspora margarita]|uniref:Uncharacterized protein n=1 Tax=Gigaspora margarita TaxID=4874 RepID=A0A8H4B154_GIGMA|nr:hypothetical protein F8M41_022551 [Gigaspora margarita]KAF0552125.1 hypothetical protein F8M41_022552 [Gigaspora margarita]
MGYRISVLILFLIIHSIFYSFVFSITCEECYADCDKQCLPGPAHGGCVLGCEAACCAGGCTSTVLCLINFSEPPQSKPTTPPQPKPATLPPPKPTTPPPPSCNYNTKCTCPSSATQGQYCGGQTGMGPSCVKTNVYECSTGGTSVCEYGYRDSCAQCGKLSC